MKSVVESLMELVRQGYFPEMLQISQMLEEDYTLSFNKKTSRLFMRKGNKAVPVPKGYEWFVISCYELKKVAEKTKAIVFISYSHKDLWMAFKIWRMLTNSGVPCYLAELYPEPGLSLWDKIKRMIESSDIVVVLYTRNARYSAYVNQELAYAHARGKIILPVVEEGVELPGVLAGLEYIKFNPLNPVSTLTSIANTIRKFLEDKERKAVAGVFLLLLGAIALLAASSEKSS